MSRFSLLAIPLLAFSVSVAHAQPSCSSQFCIGWSSISGGGGLESESAEGTWRLSGSIGEWDASGTGELQSESWRLTGGFWAVTLTEPPDEIFRDAFQVIVGDGQSQRSRRNLR